MVSKDEFHQIVVEALRNALSDDGFHIGDDDAFDDKGVDSLAAMDLLLEVEKELSIKFDEDFDLGQYNSISKLYEFLS